MKILLKREKKWTLKIKKSKIIILVLNQSLIGAVFPIHSSVSWVPKNRTNQGIPVHQNDRCHKHVHELTKQMLKII